MTLFSNAKSLIAIGFAMLISSVIPSLAEAPWPPFAQCIDSAVADYERALAPRADSADLPVELVGGDDIIHCGSLGIVTCDLSDEPLACQNALVAEQDALTAVVQGQLPAPEVAEIEGAWAQSLYRRMALLAGDSSAGPDCAGAEIRFATWCETWQANERLVAAILAWQVARMLDLAPPAIEAGWANPVSGPRPVARPISE